MGYESSSAANGPIRVLSCRCSRRSTGGATRRSPANTATGQLQFLEARHRVHARVEDRIRHAKDTGLGRLPSREFTLNQAWLVAVMIAADLVAWTRMLACTGDAAVLALCEPKALRYRFLHVAARLVRSGRRRRVKIPETWPWATAIVAVFNTIAAIPKPA
jgi:hypothetical protein